MLIDMGFIFLLQTFVKTYPSIPRSFGSSYPSLGNMIKVGQENGNMLGKVQIATTRF
jgi:hypothetical protein